MSYKVAYALLMLTALCACGDTLEHKPVVNGILEIKGIKLGMIENDVMQLVPGLKYSEFRQKQSSSYKKLICQKRFGEPENKCSITIANQAVKSAEFYFREGQLGAALLTIDENYFDTVRAGLNEKYGRPYSVEQTVLKIPLTGVESKDIKIRWENAQGHQLLIQNHEIEGNSYRPKGVIYLADVRFEKAIEADSAALGRKPDDKDL